MDRAAAGCQGTSAEDREDVTVTIPGDMVEEFRVMLREQIAGDSEALRWLRERPREDVIDRRAPHLSVERLRQRLTYLWELGDRVGGLYGVALPAVGLAISLLGWPV
jgi:hypothetical protein